MGDNKDSMEYGYVFCNARCTVRNTKGETIREQDVTFPFPLLKRGIQALETFMREVLREVTEATGDQNLNANLYFNEWRACPDGGFARDAVEIGVPGTETFAPMTVIYDYGTSTIIAKIRSVQDHKYCFNLDTPTALADLNDEVCGLILKHKKYLLRKREVEALEALAAIQRGIAMKK